MKLAICVGHLSTHVFESWKIYVFLMGGDETFGKWLKDGRVLCSVANKIQPGAAREGGRGMEESWYLLQGTDISPPKALLSRWFFHSQSGIMVVSRKVSHLMGTFRQIPRLVDSLQHQNKKRVRGAIGLSMRFYTHQLLQGVWGNLGAFWMKPSILVGIIANVNSSKMPFKQMVRAVFFFLTSQGNLPKP